MYRIIRAGLLGCGAGFMLAAAGCSSSFVTGNLTCVAAGDHRQCHLYAANGQVVDFREKQVEPAERARVKSCEASSCKGVTVYGALNGTQENFTSSNLKIDNLPAAGSS